MMCSQEFTRLKQNSDTYRLNRWFGRCRVGGLHNPQSGDCAHRAAVVGQALGMHEVPHSSVNITVRLSNRRDALVADKYAAA